MAIALAFSPTTDTSPRVPGTRRRAFFTITCDDSYPTGGYTLTASTCGLVAIHTVNVGNTSTAKPVFWTGSKLKIFSSIGTEVVNGTNIATETMVVEVIGI